MMMPTLSETKVERLARSCIRLTLTVTADSVRQAYDDLVRKYAKSAQIKGFRKGKAPRNVLERKFGEAFRAETLQELVQAALKTAVEDIDAKPLPYARPVLEDSELELATDRDLTFRISYDTFPAVELGDYHALKVERPKVTITQEDEDRDLERLRQQNALTIAKEGPIAGGDVVTLTFEEVDAADTAVAGTRTEALTFVVGEGHNLYHIDEELVGMEQGQTTVLAKEFPADFEHQEIAGTSKRIRVAIEAVKQRDLPEIDDELAQDVSDEFETLADLRADIRKRLERDVGVQLRRLDVDQVVEQIVAVTGVDVPESMVDAELEDTWRRMSQQYGVDTRQLETLLAREGRDKTELFDRWREAALERITRLLVIQKLVEVEKIEATEDDLVAFMREDAPDHRTDPQQVLEFYRGQGMLETALRNAAERKLFDRLLERAEVTVGAQRSYLDLLAENG